MVKVRCGHCGSIGYSSSNRPLCECGGSCYPCCNNQIKRHHDKISSVEAPKFKSTVFTGRI